MALTPAFPGYSAACCSIPPIVSTGYQALGSYEEIGGYKTYVTGPGNATNAIVAVYDIFGYFDQTIQGADILAFGDEEQQYRVFMPDWFGGKPCPIEYYPPDTPEKQKGVTEFLAMWPPKQAAADLPGYVGAVKEHSASVSKLGMLGASTNPFSAAAVAHPSNVEPSDAEGIAVPFALLASKDEPADLVKQFGDALTAPKIIETFADQIHGWMSARANLSDPVAKEGYVKGYETLQRFFNNFL